MGSGRRRRSKRQAAMATESVVDYDMDDDTGWLDLKCLKPEGEPCGERRGASRLQRSRGLFPRAAEGWFTVEMLGQYGMCAKSPSAWDGALQHPHLAIRVQGGDGSGPTKRYILVCVLTQVRQESAISWQHSCTLMRLRSFHDGLKYSVGGRFYELHFGGTHFAHIRGPEGTTARLAAWFGVFCTCFNERRFAPSHTLKLLSMLRPPAPGTSVAAEHPSAETPRRTLLEGTAPKACDVCESLAPRQPGEGSADDWGRLACRTARVAREAEGRTQSAPAVVRRLRRPLTYDPRRQRA